MKAPARGPGRESSGQGSKGHESPLAVAAAISGHGFQGRMKSPLAGSMSCPPVAAMAAAPSRVQGRGGSCSGGSNGGHEGFHWSWGCNGVE